MQHTTSALTLLLAVAILVACDPNDPIDPEPGCRTVTADVVVQTQEDVEALANVCEITGTLEIREALDTDDPITSLGPLSDLRTLGDEASSALRVLWTTNLTGLEGLEGVVLRDRAELRIEGNAALESLSALGAEASGAVARLTDVRVWRNPALVDLGGLENIVGPVGAEVNGELSIWDNANLTSLAGLEAITGPIGLLYIASNPALLALDLPQVTIGSLTLLELPHAALDLRLGTVQDALLIGSSHGLVTLSLEAVAVGRLLELSQNSGLEALHLVLGRAPNTLLVNQSHQLTTFDLTVAEGGLGSLSIMQAPELRSLGFEDVLVQQGLALYGTGLGDLGVFRTVPDLPGYFILRGNPHLEDIDAFSALQSVDRLQIEDNTALCVPAWVADIAVTGSTPRSVSGNLCD